MIQRDEILIRGGCFGRGRDGRNPYRLNEI